MQFLSIMPSRRDDRDPARVFLGNLPHDTRERDIERFFDKYGRVYNIFIKNGKYGFCVSTFLNIYFDPILERDAVFLAMIDVYSVY